MAVSNIKIKREVLLTGKEWTTLLVALSVYIQSLERLKDSCRIPFVDYCEYLSAVSSAFVAIESVTGCHEVHSSST